MVRELVAIDIPAGVAFVNVLNDVWDSGDAALPIDQRLPKVAQKKLMSQFNVSSLIGADGLKTKIAPGEPVDEGDALVIATSGSTGEPKGVVHTHDSINAAVTKTGARLGCSATDHWLACISLAHVGGLSVVLRALHFGSQLTIESRADKATIESAAKNGADMTSLVPTILHSVDISNFRAVLVGGAHAPTNLPSNAISTYGLTETFGGVVYNGKPIDGVEICIGTDSEIKIRCDSLLRTYRNGNDPKDSEGWLHTGDLGRLQDGDLTVLGRKDDLIKTGGYKVWPITVENSLRQHDAVVDVVVAGTPDEKWGQTVTAWVVLRPGTKSVRLEDLNKHVRLTLSDYCAHKKVFIVDEIPRSSLGKALISDLVQPHNKFKALHE
ncbi:MAG: AMP-binding protein [Acidimicrobiaceae bacterium]